jgi:hypothetical protein
MLSLGFERIRNNVTGTRLRLCLRMFGSECHVTMGVFKSPGDQIRLDANEDLRAGDDH